MLQKEYFQKQFLNTDKVGTPSTIQPLVPAGSVSQSCICALTTKFENNFILKERIIYF